MATNADWLVIVLVSILALVTGTCLFILWHVVTSKREVDKEIRDVLIHQFERMQDRCLSTVVEYDSVRQDESRAKDGMRPHAPRIYENGINPIVAGAADFEQQAAFSPERIE